MQLINGNGLEDVSLDDDEMELEQEREPIDIDFLIKTVVEGEKEGLKANEILDPDELEAYNEFNEHEHKQIDGHYDNLVPALDKTTLNMLAMNVVNWVLWDEQTRKDWSLRESDGIRLLGVSDKKLTKPLFEGASSVVHPLLAESVVQFNSRALEEIWPPEGPVKAVVLGDKTEERNAQAERVESYMNYQYTEDMPGAFEEEDALLFRLPLSGSCFKKVYYDPLLDKLCSRLIEPSDFIVPFSATDLQTASRFTHRFREMHNTVLKKLASGYYHTDKNLTIPNNETWDYPKIKTEIDHTEGRQRVGLDDSRHTMLEMYVDLDLKGFEDMDATGKLTGVALPYIVTVNRDNHETLRIQRNWSPDDDKKEKTVNCVHYKFMPGLGFYGYGLFHLIGGLGIAATGALNALLDSAAFANLQGGYKTRDSRIPGGDTPLKPGEWREINSSAEELSKAFFPIPYKQPSPVLFQLLSYLDNIGSKFVSSDIMTGDANPNAPVGTTLALIEQGAKTFSAIFRRLHVAHRNEFRILARLNALYIPEDGYPYFTAQGDRQIYASDFDKRVDIIPVSDPSIVSGAQRIVQAQAVLDLATKYPDKINQEAAIRTMLQAIRVPNYEELMKINESITQQQQKMGELDIAIKQAELDKLKSQQKLIDAQRTESSMKGIFAAQQAAQVVLTAADPLQLSQVADELYISAGGTDANGLPLGSPEQIANAMNGTASTQQAQAQPTIPKNTSPMFPANPPNNEPIEPQLPQGMDKNAMLSPDTGMNHGIETMRSDSTLQ